MKRTIMFIIASWFCKHPTVVNEGDYHACLECNVELPEEFSPHGVISLEQ